MPSFRNVRRVPFTPRQMFGVVADVQQYPEFLPLCEHLRVLRREDKDGQTVLVANMGVGYKAIRESFTSRVTLVPSDMRVLVEYLDGPFHHLQNRWQFRPAGSGADVDFFIEYEFRSAMLGLLMGAVFDKTFRKFSQAFEDRAHVVYGRPGGLPRPVEAK